jgi:AraC-like DNA-binding protein
MDFIIGLFLAFVVFGVLLSLIFLNKKKGDKYANRLLALYTFLFAFELLNNVLRWSGALRTETFVHFNLVHFPLWAIYGPLVYLYVRRVTKKISFRTTDILFLLPVLAIAGTISPFYILNTTKKLELVNAGAEFSHIPWPSYGIWLVILLMFFYSFLSYFSFRKNRQTGYRENVWLKWFVGSYTGFVFMFSLYIFMIWFNLMDPKYDYFVDIVIVFFIGLLAFFGFVQPEVFEGRNIREILPFIKYRKTGLSDALSLQMKEKLLAIMLDSKPYLDPALRLDDLSLLIHLSRNQTSQIINEHFNLSFFDFVNRYRVMEAKNMLMDFENQGLTMSQLAYEVGFNNRASFYKAFKKFTGYNPSAYLEQSRAS